MPTDLYRWFPEEGVKIALVLFLCFLTGLEREERAKDGGKYRFGGVRTFPLIGLIGYAMAFLSGGQMLPVALGFAVISGFLMLSYRQKMALSEQAGVTTEMSGLTTYLVGALVYHEQFWIATTLSVAGMLLLELKEGLENVSKRIDSAEIFTFTKFLLLTAVILPVLPRQDLGPFQINPFKTWLVVVAVSTVSYGSYVVQKLTRGHGGIMFAAVLGGLYSSTVATVALSRRARHEARPHLFSAAMLVACGIMYLRITALLAIFNHALFVILGVPFALLAMAAAGGALFWSRIIEPGATEPKREYEPRNPLEMRAALGFALLFVLMMVATRLVSEHLGKTGVYGLAGLMGVTDVDPFIMGMTQSAGAAVALKAGAAAILIAAASNNVIKGIYSYFLCDRQTGRQSLVLLVGLAVAGLLPLFWLWF
jgi:uncharacterized membrane protein (DUF4010 family)